MEPGRELSSLRLMRAVPNPVMIPYPSSSLIYCQRLCLFLRRGRGVGKSEPLRPRNTAYFLALKKSLSCRNVDGEMLDPKDYVGSSLESWQKPGFGGEGTSWSLPRGCAVVGLMEEREGTNGRTLYPGSWSGRPREDIKNPDLFAVFPSPGGSRPVVTCPECNVLLQLPRHHITNFPTLGKFGEGTLTCVLEAVPLVGVAQETSWGGKCLVLCTDRGRLVPWEVNGC